MLHTHTYPAEVVEQVRDEARNTGEDLPDWITNAPVLRLGLVLFLDAWFELDYERDRTRLQPIKRSSTFDYARDYDFSEEQREDLWFYISRMDREFLRWYSQHLKAMNGGNSN